MANPVVESAMARNGPDTPGGINNPGEDMGGSLTVLMAGLLVVGVVVVAAAAVSCCWWWMWMWMWMQ